MKFHDHLSSAKAVIALLILAIAFGIFYKLYTSQSYFTDDPEALRNYVMFAIVASGFLIGLLYLTSQTSHKISSKSAKSSKKRRK